MGLGYKRADLRANAEAKLNDALLLLQNQRWSNAYYLAGYAVELSLKACISTQFVAEVIPEKSYVNSIFSHKLADLVGLAGLWTKLREQQAADLDFAANWGVSAQWTENARYESSDAISAQALIAAISDQKSGVFQWIKRYW